MMIAGLCIKGSGGADVNQNLGYLLKLQATWAERKQLICAAKGHGWMRSAIEMTV